MNLSSWTFPTPVNMKLPPFSPNRRKKKSFYFSRRILVFLFFRLRYRLEFDSLTITISKRWILEKCGISCLTTKQLKSCPMVFRRFIHLIITSFSVPVFYIRDNYVVKLLRINLRHFHAPNASFVFVNNPRLVIEDSHIYTLIRYYKQKNWKTTSYSGLGG